MADIVILLSMPEDIWLLRNAGREEGFDLVERLVTDWNAWSNRFDVHGEVLLGARRDGRLVAVGGLNRDPYVDDPTVGRIRHVYVHPEARGEGVGRQLVSELVNRARRHFRRVRVRAGPPGADVFYERLGFDRSPEPDATHHLVL